MKAGDEASAAKFLQSEAKIKAEQVDPAQRNLDAATQNFETVQKAYNKLAGDIEFMRNEMNNIKYCFYSVNMQILIIMSTTWQVKTHRP